jgi:signal transduction histidine kinase
MKTMFGLAAARPFAAACEASPEPTVNAPSTDAAAMRSAIAILFMPASSRARRQPSSLARTFPLRPGVDGDVAAIHPAVDARGRMRLYGGTVRARRVPPLGLALSDRFSERQVDWLAFGATLVLSVPAVVHAVANGELAISLAVLPFATVPLLWRREHAEAVLAVLVAALAVAVLAGRSAPGNVGVMFGLYASALYGGERLRALSGFVVGGTSVAAFVLLVVTGRARLAPHVTAALVFGAATAWVLGEVARTRRAYLAALEERAARLERERDEHARRAIEEERMRIARELHDVVAHTLTTINVRAAAAAERLGPGEPRTALEKIEQASHDAIGELRAILGVLRDPDGSEAPRAPVPGVENIAELVRRTRDGGVDVGLEVSGERPPHLSDAVSLAAYRIVQESLTNAQRHAPRAAVRVCLDYDASRLSIAVENDAAAPPAGNGATPGIGIAGMRERATAIGGTLHAGQIEDRFRVRAELPYELSR